MRPEISRISRQLLLVLCIFSFFGWLSGSAAAQTEQATSTGSEQAEIVSFTLVDADNDVPLAGYDPLEDGAEIDLGTLPTLNLNILVNFSNGKIGSIAFDYDDSADYTIDSFQPFTLEGDNNGDFYGWTPGVGEHTITATIYSAENKGGEAGSSASVSFVVVSSAENIPPAVNVRSDAVMTLPTNSTILNGFAKDPDGSDENMTILWSVQDVPPGADFPTMSGVNSVSLLVEGLVLGTYRFRLNAIDEYGAGNYADAYVYVYAPENQPPLVDGGGDIDIALPVHSTTIYASVIDDGYVESYFWEQIDGPMSVLMNGRTGPTLTVSGLKRVGGYVFELTVMDDDGTTATDTVAVSVNPDPTNQSATVETSENIEMTLPENSAEISARATDSDGVIQSVEWYKKSGPNVTISPTNTLTTTVSNLQAGDYVFRVIVYDNSGNATYESVRVKVNDEPNVAPALSIGEDVRLAFPTSSVEISANANDEDGLISAYVWTQEDGPANAVLWNTDSDTLEVTNMVIGTYTFKLTVYDDDGATTVDRVQVTVANETQAASAEISGELVKWHPLTLSFDGPQASEGDESPNPFLDYRMVVDFMSPDGQTYRVPGFFAGNGLGGSAGDQWQVRFSADAVGEWRYVAHFDAGENIAVDLDYSSGTPTSFDAGSGTFTVAALDSSASGFLSQGRLQYVGEHYLKSADGGYWIKGGSGSPENLLGYAGFDDTVDQGRFGGGMTNGVHRFAPHISDWRNGDPLWTGTNEYGNVDSKGIIGAINYLASQQVNSLVVTPMNLGGDGQETYPFLQAFNDEFSKSHYDLSKLNQWNQLFDHAQRQGIQLHFMLADEANNRAWLDDGALGIEHKLFYRELVARYGYLLGVKWNLGEEFAGDVATFAEHVNYLNAFNWAQHPVSIHTAINSHQLLNAEMAAPDAAPLVDVASLQYATNLQGLPVEQEADTLVEDYRAISTELNHKWVVDLDENNPADVGLTAANTSTLRKRVLYAALFSGGNIEWYMGQGLADIELEDFRTRETMWQQMAIARNFMLDHLPFWDMQPNDNLLEYGRVDGQVFMKQGEVYAIYLPDGLAGEETARIDLSADNTAFTQTWFNPRSDRFVSRSITVRGGRTLNLGKPPQDVNDDWIVLLQSGEITDVAATQFAASATQEGDAAYLTLTATCLLLMAGARMSVLRKKEEGTDGKPQTTA